MKHLITWSLSR